jgi:hypothetical protein
MLNILGILSAPFIISHKTELFAISDASRGRLKGWDQGLSKLRRKETAKIVHKI